MTKKQQQAANAARTFMVRKRGENRAQSLTITQGNRRFGKEQFAEILSGGNIRFYYDAAETTGMSYEQKMETMRKLEAARFPSQSELCQDSNF